MFCANSSDMKLINKCYTYANILYELILGSSDLNQQQIVLNLREKHYSLLDFKVEHFFVTFLCNQGLPIDSKKIATGNSHEIWINFKKLFKLILDGDSSEIIISHNHPSGALYPSKEDIALTNQIMKYCKIFNIRLKDHLILTNVGYYSFAEHNSLS